MKTSTENLNSIFLATDVFSPAENAADLLRICQ